MHRLNQFCDLTALVELAYCFVNKKTVDTDCAVQFDKKYKHLKVFEDTKQYMKLRLENRKQAEKVLTNPKTPFSMLAAYLFDKRDHFDLLKSKSQKEESKQPSPAIVINYDTLIGLVGGLPDAPRKRIKRSRSVPCLARSGDLSDEQIDSLRSSHLSDDQTVKSVPDVTLPKQAYFDPL